MSILLIVFLAACAAVFTGMPYLMLRGVIPGKPQPGQRIRGVWFAVWGIGMALGGVLCVLMIIAFLVFALT